MGIWTSLEVYELGLEAREIHMRCGEICALLGNYEACRCTSLPTFRDYLLIPPVRIKKSKASFWISWPLKMGQIRFSETSVLNYHFTLRNITEKRIFHQLRLGCLNSRTEFIVEILIIVNQFFLINGKSFGINILQFYEYTLAECVEE
jgi:hypothetical protein